MKEERKEKILAMLEITAEFFAALLYWEILLYLQIHNTLKGFGIWNILFLLPFSCFLSGFTGFFSRHRKINRILQIIVTLGVSLLYLIDLIYYKIFGSLFSVSMLGNGTNAVTGFWWSLKTTLIENIGLLILLEIPLFVLILLAVFKKNEKNYYGLLSHVMLLAMSLLLWLAIVYALPISGTQDYTAYGAYHSRYIDTDTASGKLGVLPNFVVELRYSLFGYDDAGVVLQANAEVSIEEEKTEEIKKAEKKLYNQFAGLDFGELSLESEDASIRALCEYFSQLSPSEKNEYTGMFSGYNLIYICAESFSRMAIDEQITPVLYEMANHGIVLNNYYNSFRNTTTNGEYAFLTGLWPDVARQNTNMGNTTGTMGQSANKDMHMALGNMFNASAGINARAYHNYYGYYYGRERTLPNMGFTCKFMGDGMSFSSAWPASDLEMMEQSVDDYINDERFCTYYMTFSGHGNYTTDNIMVYRNINEVSSKIDTYLPTSAIGYLSCNYELEKAMAYLLQRLEEAGQLDRTVIVLTGDHYPYYLTDAGYEALTGESMDPNFESYKSTCIIYNAGMEEDIVVDTPCCNVDILPTILNLFGISYDSRLYAGSDIFGNDMHIAQLYNRSFITENVKYNAVTGKADWLIDTGEYEEDKLEAYLDNAINTVRNRYAISIEIADTDFYRFVFDHYDVKDLRKGFSKQMFRSISDREEREDEESE